MIAPVPPSKNDDLLGLDLSDRETGAGRWRLESLASEEMLGKVYTARDLTSGKLVHIKVLHPGMAGDSEKFARFGRELTATRMVRHPNTIQIVDWGQHKNLHFLVLEFLATHTLESEIQAGGLPPERVAAIVAQVASAIGVAHQEGIIHRNLNPTNILLLDNVPGGAVFAKVRDFGLSRLEKFGEESTTLTQAGARIGNVNYMPPEYIEDDRVHPKGDLYALGALTYHMLTGHPPFRGKAVEVLTRHVTDDAPRPSSERPNLPRWCDEAVGSLMAKSPDERPGAYQIVQFLEKAVGHSLQTPKLLGIDDQGSVIRPSRMPFYVAIAGGGLLTLGVGLVALTMVFVGVWWVVANADGLMASAPERELAPLPGSELPAPVAAAPEPLPSAPGAAPAPTPRAAPRAKPAPAAPGASPTEPPSAAPVATVKVRANRRVLVYVDDLAVGYTPLDHPLPPGAHVISALVPGQLSTRQDQQVKVERGGEPVVEFQF